MHRLISAAIVVFWFVMTLLLVRNEISPGASRLRDEPVAHVLKLLYQHEQPSTLTIYKGAGAVGSLRLHPHLDKDRQTRLLDFSGDLQLALSTEQQTHLGWLGQLALTDAGGIGRSKWSITLLAPGYLRADIETPAGATSAHFTLRTRERVLNEGELPLDEGALAGIAKQLPVGASLGSLAPQARRRSPMTVRARQSSLRWRGERTETHLVSLEQDGEALVEVHFSQLGQALYAKTALGYTLRASDLAE